MNALFDFHRMQKLWTHGVGHYCTLRFLWGIWNLLECCCDIKQM